MNKIFEFAVKRPVSITVIVIALVILSGMFATRMNIESFPRIEIPVITVSVAYPGAGPEEIENQVVIPLEEAVGSVGNIIRVESAAMDNVGVVLVEFEYGTNMSDAVADIREKVDKIKKDLPDNIENPVITKANTSDTPIVRLALSDKNKNMRRLSSIAENQIKKELEKIAGIASVTVAGSEDRAIVISVDQSRLESLGVPANAVAQSVAKENSDVPSGRISAKNMEFTVRAMGELKSVGEFENILVYNVNGKPVYLRDIATVSDANKEVRTFNRNNGEPCVTLEVRKNNDANTVVVADKIREMVGKVNETLPAGFELKMAYDTSISIKEAVNNLMGSAIQGGLLAILMVFLFLGSFRSTLIIGISIPITIAITFLSMYFGGITINMITLVALILVVGNIVDASIVMLENIFRHLEMGTEPTQAALDGANEVGMAIFGGVMTTVVAFLPILIITGLAGQIFTPLAKTFIFAILCSMASSFTITPMLSPRILVREMEDKKNPKGIMLLHNKYWDPMFEKFKHGYKSMLFWSMNHRKFIVLIAFIVLGFSLYLGSLVGSEMSPKFDRGDFLVKVETPVGSSLERTKRVVDEVEKFTMEETKGESQNVIVDIGRGPSGAQGAGKSFSSNSANMGGLTVNLVSADERKRSVFEIQDKVAEHFKDYPGAKVEVQEIFSISGKKPIEIAVKGNDMDKLTEIANNLKAKFEGVEDLKNLDLNYRPGAPEYRIRIDRKKAADLGLGAGEIYQTLRALMAEDSISKYREEGNEYDIFMQLPPNQRNSIEKVGALKFITPSGNYVALRDICTIVPAFSPSSISRRDRSRYVSVQADIKSGSNASAAMNKIMPIMKSMSLPPGYTLIVAGEVNEQKKIFGQMFQAITIAVILIYVFLALQFESFIHPFTVMLTIPLELLGVFAALLLTRQTVNMFVLLGLLMLAGIVVNGAIVLIDYFIQRKEKGLSTREAVLEAAPLRLRPILMTVLSTSMGMFPLALGLTASARMFQSLAIASIGGLMTSTLLTLIVIPVVYSIFEDLTEKFFKKSS